MSNKAQQQSQRLSQVLQYIEDNLHKDISVEILADISHWSRWQLQRVFNAHTGLSIAQYVRQLRLSQSAMHLISGDQRHLDIAVNAGFGSEVSFSRAFRQHFGCTPRAYRRRGVPSGIHFSLNNAPMHSIRLEHRPAFTLFGQYCDIYGIFSTRPDFKEKVPKLWRRVIRHLDDLEVPCNRLLSVVDVTCFSGTRQRYWFGSARAVNPESRVEADTSAVYRDVIEQVECDDVPVQPLLTLSVPEQLYAVVTHIGPPVLLAETISWFITHWLNQSPYEAFEGFDIEEHSRTGDHRSGQNRVDYWIPIRPIARRNQPVSDDG